MIANGSHVFLVLPGESRHVLHPGTVGPDTDGLVTAIFEEPNLVAEAGVDVLLHYEIQRRFVQHPARVEALVVPEPKTVVGLRLIGEAVSAEKRQVYRVSTALTNRMARLGPEEECKLVDVCISGCSIASPTQYEVGDVVEIALECEGVEFAGSARIQNVKELPDGLFRYGLMCLQQRRPGNNLEKGLHQTSMLVQREQLQRQAAGGSF